MNLLSEKSLKFLRIASVVILFIGGLNWLFLFVSYMGLFGEFLRGKELQLGWVDDIAVDDRGFIYCNSGYSRIQVYDTNGTFKDSWHIEATGGLIFIKMEEGNLLNVYTVRNNRHFVYNTDGLLIKNENRTSKSENRHSCLLNPCKDGAGNLFQMESGFPALISKTTSSGNKSTIISQPIFFILLTAPFPGWLFIIFGVICLRLTRDKKMVVNTDGQE